MGGGVGGEGHTSRCSVNSRGVEPRPPHNNAAEYSEASRGLRFVLCKPHAAAVTAAAAAACASACMRRVPVLVHDRIWLTSFYLCNAAVPHSTAKRNPRFLSNMQLTELSNNRRTPPPTCRCAPAACSCAAVLVVFFSCMVGTWFVSRTADVVITWTKPKRPPAVKLTFAIRSPKRSKAQQ